MQALACHRNQLVLELWAEAEVCDWQYDPQSDLVALVRRMFSGLRETKRTLENCFGLMRKSGKGRWTRYNEAIAAHTRECHNAGPFGGV